MLQFVSACELACSSFYFAKGWHFVCRFTVRLLSVVSSIRVAPNVLGASVVGLSKPSLSLPINVCLKILMFLSKDK